MLWIHVYVATQAHAHVNMVVPDKKWVLFHHYAWSWLLPEGEQKLTGLQQLSSVYLLVEPHMHCLY